MPNRWGLGKKLKHPNGGKPKIVFFPYSSSRSTFMIRLREVVLKPCQNSTQTSITSILSLSVKTVLRIFLHSVVFESSCRAGPKMHSANVPHLGKSHVRPWVHDPGNLTDVCLMLTLGNPSPCLSLYPCLPAESRPKMTGWSDFRVRGRRLGGGTLGPQGRRVRHGHH